MESLFVSFSSYQMQCDHNRNVRRERKEKKRKNRQEISFLKKFSTLFLLLNVYSSDNSFVSENNTKKSFFEKEMKKAREKRVKIVLIT